MVDSRIEYAPGFPELMLHLARLAQEVNGDQWQTFTVNIRPDGGTVWIDDVDLRLSHVTVNMLKPDQAGINVNPAPVKKRSPATCPRCGAKVKRKALDCKKCGRTWLVSQDTIDTVDALPPLPML